MSDKEFKEKIKKLNEEFDRNSEILAHRTEVENKAMELIAQGKNKDANKLLETI